METNMASDSNAVGFYRRSTPVQATFFLDTCYSAIYMS